MALTVRWESSLMKEVKVLNYFCRCNKVVLTWSDPFDTAGYCLATDNSYSVLCGVAMHNRIQLYDKRTCSSVQVTIFSPFLLINSVDTRLCPFFLFFPDSLFSVLSCKKSGGKNRKHCWRWCNFHISRQMLDSNVGQQIYSGNKHKISPIRLLNVFFLYLHVFQVINFDNLKK